MSSHWEDNKEVVHILNTMTTRSPALMKELRALHPVMLTLGISIESRYGPSAVNRFSDRFSRLQLLEDGRINTLALRALLYNGTNNRPVREPRFNDLETVQQSVPLTGVIRNRFVTTALGANGQLS